MSDNLKGYNPQRNERGDAFNKDAGRKVFSETAKPFTDEQKQQSARRLENLIILTNNQLNEDAL